MKRNRITFFASYFEALRELPDAEQLALFRAIMFLAFEGKEPRFESPIARSIWAAIRPNIQATINKSNAGMIGGGKFGNQNARKTPITENVDFEEINPQKNQQKSIKNPSENQQKTNNKEKDKGIKEKDKEKNKDIQDNNSNESLSIVDNITSNEVCQIWNEICAPAGLQKVMKMTTKRQEKARCRLRDWQAGGADARNTFREICNAIAASSFCRGQNSHKWEATFDWIIENDSNYVKVLEGKYNDKQTTDYGSRHLNERAAENEYWRQQHELARSIVAGGGNPATFPDDGAF
jgi:hypothetical protein